MDKDSVILKHIQNKADDCEENLEEIRAQNSKNAKRLSELDDKLEKIHRLLGTERKPFIYEVRNEAGSSFKSANTEPKSYEELFQEASESLAARGIDIDTLDYHGLVTEEELRRITDSLNRPLERKLKWSKNDFIVVFIAASIGSLVDCILSDRENKFTGKGSQFAEWLDEFHQHDGGGPIDYQGPGFGGGYHRGLSKGHDIMRFIEAIIMFKTGRFEGIRYVDGVAHKVVSTVNQYGTPYEQLGWIEAIAKYAQHMFADLFSSCSLPFPGSSLLVECGNRDMRIFAATMYHQGFNIKNIMIQSISTIMVEIIMRIYFGIDEMKRYGESVEIQEDYSNFEALGRFIRSTGKEKLHEMLLLAHAVVAAVNVGKVVITKKPWEINITEIISVIRYAVPVLSDAIDRHSGYAKLIRNADEINANWEALAIEFSVDRLQLEFKEDALTI